MTTDLATALANLEKAHDRLRMANMRASEARIEEAEAINEANKAQKEFAANGGGSVRVAWVRLALKEGTTMTHSERILGALYVSEGWYAAWQNYMTRGISRPDLRARAVVAYDRVLNKRSKND